MYGYSLVLTVCVCYLVGVWSYPANDIYLQMALERAKNAAYPAGWYADEYPDYRDVIYENEAEQKNGENSEEVMVPSTDFEVDAYWPSYDVTLGQVSGLAMDEQDNPVIFHRGDHPWIPGKQLFDMDNNFLAKEAGPITMPTVVTMESDTGAILDAWGDNMFYMPHGISTDVNGNVWLTDVAMHQVFKFAPGSDEPELVLGQAFEPAKDGQDKERFCKPTDVAVSSNGDIFVADGYCNSRVVRFSAEGEYLGQFGDDDLFIPHSLALAEELDLLCVADRENKRILCYNAGLQSEKRFGELEREYEDPAQAKIYAIEYNDETGMMFVVTSPTYTTPGTGYSFDLHDVVNQQDIIDVWSPYNQGFTAPHDVTVSRDGAAIFVGEITLDKTNLWKFINIAQEDMEEDEESQVGVGGDDSEWDEAVDDAGSELDDDLEVNGSDLETIENDLESESEAEAADESDVSEPEVGQPEVVDDASSYETGSDESESEEEQDDAEEEDDDDDVSNVEDDVLELVRAMEEEQRLLDDTRQSVM